MSRLISAASIPSHRAPGYHIELLRLFDAIFNMCAPKPASPGFIKICQFRNTNSNWAESQDLQIVQASRHFRDINSAIVILIHT